MTYYLYFLFDHQKLIYIGITNNIKRRLMEHTEKGFNSVRLVRCISRDVTSRYERLLIGRYRPELNNETIGTKPTASFKIRPELRKALKKEADKDKRTLSWYLENIVEEFAKRRKLAP